MRYLIAITATLLISVPVHAAEKVLLDGSWVYRARDANVTVRLKPEGECAVTGSLARHVTAEQATGVVALCTYSIRGPNVTLEWKNEVLGKRPASLELVLIAEGMVMRVEGESERLLRRVVPGTVIGPQW